MKSASQFSSALAQYELELSQRLGELGRVTFRTNNNTFIAAEHFVWLDELESAKETITASLEQRGTATPFNVLLDFAEACADNLERALIRAENVAATKFNVQVAAPAPLASPSREISLKPMPSTTTTTTVRKPLSIATPQRTDGFMPFSFDDPPTPPMVLSSATLSMLNKKL